MNSYGSPQATWCISEDSRGFIYVASNMGLLEYDGSNWSTYYIDNNSGIRTVYAHPSGRIYVGAVQTFGYFEPDSTGYLEYKSLCPLLNDSILNFSDVWQIKACDPFIYFHSMHKLFRYNPSDNTLFTYNAKTDFHLMGIFKNQLYIGQTGFGLCKVDGDSVVLTNGGEFFKNKTIYNILPYDEDNILITTKFEVIIFNITQGKLNDKQTQSFNANLMLYNERFYNIFKVDVDKFGISTLNNGAYIVDKKGIVKKHFSIDNILPSNVLFYGLESKNGNIWLGLDNGVFKIESSLPFSKLEYNRKNLLPINCVNYFKNSIFFTTNIGLFSKSTRNIDRRGNDYPVNIGNSNFRCFELSYYINATNGKIDTSLLMPSEEGIYLFKDGVLKQITDKIVFLIAQQSKFDRNIIYLSSNKGLAYLKYPSNKFSDIQYVPQVKSSVMKIVEDKEGKIWVSTSTDGFYYLERKGDVFKVLYHFEQKGERSYIDYAYLKDNKIFFIYKNEFWSFSPDTYELIQSQNLLSNTFKDWSISLFSTYKDSIFWYNLIDEKNQIPLQVIGDKIPNYNTLFRRLNGLGIRNVYQESSDKVWFGSSNGVICAQNFSNCNSYNVKPLLYIRSITVNNDSLIFEGAGSKGTYSFTINDSIATINQKISYSNNRVTISVSSPFLIAESKSQYCHYLKGFEKGWSEWSDIKAFNYQNLPHGFYTLYVKARNVFGTESSTVSVNFTITPPWYRTIYTHLGGTVLFMLIVFLTFKRIQRRHNIEKYKLERIINQRTSEIINQKSKILSQIKLLDISNKSLQQLSVVAQETNNPVIITNAYGEIEWINKSFYHYSDFVMNDEVKTKVSELFNNDDIDERITTSIHQKKPISYLGQFSTSLMKNIWFQITINPIKDDNENITNLILVCSDITNVIELNKTRDLIISVITHDLKSPLLGFKMMAKSLSDNIDSIDKAKIKEWVTSMHSNSSDIYELIENLTQWFKSQRGMITFLPVPLDLHMTVNEVFAVFEPQAATKGIRLANLIKNDTYIVADENMVRTILRNLLSNAIKFTEMGMVCVTTEDLCDEFVISVTDEGAGIDNETIAKLLANEYSDSIGLMICKEFLQKNDGRLMIESSSEGSTFSFVLPKLFKN